MKITIKQIVPLLGFVLAFSFQEASAQDQEHGYRESFTSDKITFALTGDAIITRKLSPYQEPQFLSMIRILRMADVAYTNLEMLFHNYEGYPAAHSGGTWMRAEPTLVNELTWAGFDMVSLANNHTGDFGFKGLESTIQTVDKAGLTYAGAGKNLAEARVPGYLETDAGRIAIISVASTFSDEDRAGRQRKDMKGRPGLNPLRYKTTYTVTNKSLQDLERIAQQAGISLKKQNNGVRFLDNYFTSGSKTGLATEPHEGDLKEILQAVKEADRQADWILVASHTHEGKDRQTPPEFFKIFARSAIDAGADIVVGHGPHALRPIEIYNGRPIFYSLGDFIFENETVKKLPEEMYESYGVAQDSLPGYLQDKRIEESGSNSFTANPKIWESVIAVPTFNNTSEGQISTIVLHPITLGYAEPRPQRGRPRLADKKLGRKIIEELKNISEPYGTEIKYDVKKNIGKIIFN